MDALEHMKSAARALVERAGDRVLDLEVRIVRTDHLGYEVHGRELSPQLSLGRVQVGMRALTSGGLALAATTSLDVDENLAALRASLGSARPTPLTAFADLAGAPVGDAPDPAWVPWWDEPDRLHGLAAGLRDGLYHAHGNDPRLVSLEGSLGLTTRQVVLATPRGEAGFETTHGRAWVMVNGGHEAHRFLAGPPDEAALAEVAGLGRDAFEAVPARSVTPAEVGLSGGHPVPAVLDPRFLEDVLRYAGQEKFLGGSVRIGLSGLTPGQAVWDPSVSLVDSGRATGLATRRPFDDEGVPTRDTALVEDGRFAGWVWSRRSGAEADPAHPSTGNGYRRPLLVEEPNEAPVRDGLSGLVMAPGSESREALFGGMDRGLYVLSCLGIHGADTARAAFSATVADGFWVEGGRVVATLAPGRWNVSGRLFDDAGEAGLLSSVGLSSERLDTGTARLPWVRTRLGL